jgi:hypothetical protein
MDKADTYYLILQILAPIVTFLATVFAILTIFVLHRIQYKSAHVHLLKWMSYCGLIFRLLSPWQFILTLNYEQTATLTIFRVPFCLGESVLINLLCWSCFYT